MNNNLLLSEILAVIIIIAAFYKTIYLYHYTLACFRNIKTDERLQGLYQLVIDKKATENIRTTIFGIMYLYVVIPQNVPRDLINEYLKEHLRFLEEALSVQSLYGLVRTKKRRFIVDDSDQKEVIYLIKFIPILNGFTVKRIIFVVSLIAIITAVIFKYNVGNLLMQLI